MRASLAVVEGEATSCADDMATSAFVAIATGAVRGERTCSGIGVDCRRCRRCDGDGNGAEARCSRRRRAVRPIRQCGGGGGARGRRAFLSWRQPLSSLRPAAAHCDCAGATASRRATAATTTTCLSSSSSPSPSPPPNNDDDDDDEAAYVRESLPLARELDRFLNHPLFELFLTVAVLTVAAFFAIETLPQVSSEVRRVLERIEGAISSLFVVEYVLRFYSQNLDPRYLLRKSMIIDFIAIFPLFVVQRMSADAFEFGFVRLLRILRILRLERLVEEDTFRRFFTGRGKHSAAASSSSSSSSSYAEFKLRIAQITFTLFSILWITSGLVYDAEHVANAEQFGTFFDAFYFSVVTLTTVGFGDKVPVTPVGRGVIAAAILVGVAIVPFQIGQLGKAALTGGDGERNRRDGSRRQLVGGSGGGGSGEETDAAQYETFAAVVVADDDVDAVQRACERCGARDHAADARYCRICGERLPPSSSSSPPVSGGDAVAGDGRRARHKPATENNWQ